VFYPTHIQNSQKNPQVRALKFQQKVNTFANHEDLKDPGTNNHKALLINVLHTNDEHSNFQKVALIADDLVTKI